MAFDCIYIWVFCVPYTYALVTFTSLGIETLYPLHLLIHPLKAILGLVVVYSGIWAKNLVGGKVEASL
jgi:Na+-driven multidrug efflux pump